MKIYIVKTLKDVQKSYEALGDIEAKAFVSKDTAKSYLYEQREKAIEYFKGIGAKNENIDISNLEREKTIRYCVGDSNEYFHGELFEQELDLNIDTSKLAVDIVDIFEELLDKYGILIPDDCREGHENEACIYGESYYVVENSIKELLDKELE